jgi:tripartite-type tricarboxylate transporter receptor subunit TctC
MINRRLFLAKSGFALAASALAPAAFASSHQNLARIIVGFPAGGAIDAAARLIAEHMKSQAPALIVENRPGAGGRIALDALKGSPADGSIVALTPGDQLTLFPHIYSRLSYKPLEDFAPISTICSVQFLLTVGPAVPDAVKTVADFVAWCRDNPKLATYGSPGAGTRPHFLGVALKQAANFEFVHLAYKGSAAAIQDMLGGHVAANFGAIGSTIQLVQSGQLRALATSAPFRNAALPAVPTFRESGFPEAEVTEWFGALAPAKTPSSIVESLKTSIHAALASPNARAAMAKLSLDIRTSSPSELAELIRSDTQRSAEIVKVSGFKPVE